MTSSPNAPSSNIAKKKSKCVERIVQSLLAQKKLFKLMRALVSIRLLLPCSSQRSLHLSFFVSPRGVVENNCIYAPRDAFFDSRFYAK